MRIFYFSLFYQQFSNFKIEVDKSKTRFTCTIHQFTFLAFIKSSKKDLKYTYNEFGHSDHHFDAQPFSISIPWIIRDFFCEGGYFCEVQWQVFWYQICNLNSSSCYVVFFFLLIVYDINIRCINLLRKKS